MYTSWGGKNVKRKIVGMIICTLMIAAVVLPTVGSLKADYKSSSENPNLENFQLKGAFSGEGSNVDNWAITPSIDLTDVIAPRLVIFTRYEILPLGDVDFGYIKVSNNSGSSWTELQKIQGYTPIYNIIEMDLELWNDETIKIGFEYKTESGSISDGWWIIDIVVRGIVEEVYHEDFSSYDLGDPWDDWTILHDTAVPNAPPDNPSINGPTRAKAGVEYEYQFYTVDPDGDDVYYKIKWGDGEETDWIGPSGSGQQILRSHNYSEMGDYTIEAKAKDHKGEESKWGSLQITMPKNKETNKQLLLQFLKIFIDRFPMLEYMLRLYLINNG
jgi:hypothetical protein